MDHTSTGAEVRSRERDLLGDCLRAFGNARGNLDERYPVSSE